MTSGSEDGARALAGTRAVDINIEVRVVGASISKYEYWVSCALVGLDSLRCMHAAAALARSLVCLYLASWADLLCE